MMLRLHMSVQSRIAEVGFTTRACKVSALLILARSPCLLLLLVVIALIVV